MDRKTFERAEKLARDIRELGEAVSPLQGCVLSQLQLRELRIGDHDSYECYEMMITDQTREAIIKLVRDDLETQYKALTQEFADL